MSSLLFKRSITQRFVNNTDNIGSFDYNNYVRFISINVLHVYNNYDHKNNSIEMNCLVYKFKRLVTKKSEINTGKNMTGQVIPINDNFLENRKI